MSVAPVGRTVSPVHASKTAEGPVGRLLYNESACHRMCI